MGIKERIHSAPETQITKAMAAILVYLTKDDKNSFVKEYQHGSYKVKWIRSVATFIEDQWRNYQGLGVGPLEKFLSDPNS